MQSDGPPEDHNLGRKTDRCASNYDTRQMEINALIELHPWWEISDDFMRFWVWAIKET